MSNGTGKKVSKLKTYKERTSPLKTRQSHKVKTDKGAEDLNANKKLASQCNGNRDILLATNSLRAEVTTIHDEVLTAIRKIRKDLSPYAGRLNTAENRICKTEDFVAQLEDRMGKLQKILNTY